MDPEQVADSEKFPEPIVEEVQDGSTVYRATLLWKEDGFQALSVTRHSKSSWIPEAVTGRSIDEYMERLPQLDFDSRLQYVEVGAGLGGLMQYLVEQVKPSKVPVAIDYVHYPSVKEALRRIRSKTSCESIHDQIDVYDARCDLMIENKKVKWIGCSLSESINCAPEISQSADRVIDLAGPSYHPFSEAPASMKYALAVNHVVALEKRLLKAHGKLILPGFVRTN